MVVVTVRETYDLATVKNKMTLIAVHTPQPDIIKRNFPGLLMQCKAYRPLSCDVRIACASVQPLDPLGVGTSEGDVAPEDMFNPILYKAMTNVGMSQLEARINALGVGSTATLNADILGNTAKVDVDDVSVGSDEFPIYYGLLSNYHGWKTASPQSGIVMTDLKPLVYEILANFADQAAMSGNGAQVGNAYSNYPDYSGNTQQIRPNYIRGNAKPVPFMNCTSYSTTVSAGGEIGGIVNAGFSNVDNNTVFNGEVSVPYINCVVAGLIIPPSRLHQLFYRMVVEWHIEFTGIRPLCEILPLPTVAGLGNATHYQNYNYAEAKKALTGDDSTILDNDTCMVSTNADIKKVM